MANAQTANTDAPGTPPPGAAPPISADTSYLDPMSQAQIEQAATSSVNSSIDAQTNPLMSQIGSLQGQMGGALSEIGGMFGSLMPYVQDEAKAVGASYDQAQFNEANIFSAATQQLNALKNQRAAEAQALAQKMGGPVALGEFTASVEPDQELLARQGATQQLHTLGFAEAGKQAANAFAGQVFPVLRTEAEARARSFYQGQIKTAQDQINALQAQKGSQIQQKITDMQIQERTYALQKAQADLAKLDSDRSYRNSQRTFGDQEKQAEHDWKVAQNTMRNDNRRTALAESDTTGTYKGKPTEADKRLAADIKNMTVQQRQQAIQLGLSEKEYELRVKALDTSTSYNNQRLASANKQTYAAYLDAAVNPKAGKSVTQTVAVPVAAAAAISGRIKDAYADKGSKTGYSRLVKETYTPTNQPITDPTALVDYLTAHNVPQKIAVQMVKARLQIPNWTYGQGNPRSGTGRGYKPKG